MGEKKSSTGTNFSRREGEVMEILFRRGSATAREVWTELGESRTYSTIRKILSILEEKGHLTHHLDGSTFIYTPVQKKETAATSAVSRVVETFFQGSVAGAVSNLLGNHSEELSREDLDRLALLIEEAKKNQS